MKGTAGVLGIVSDETVMSIFAKNCNTEDPIHLFVGFDEVGTTIDLEASKMQATKTLTIHEIEDEDFHGSQCALVVHGGSPKSVASNEEVTENSKTIGADLEELDGFEALMDDYDGIGLESENVMGQETVANLVEDEDVPGSQSAIVMYGGS